MQNATSHLHSAIPGTGLSYTDLCNTEPGSEERTMWSALSKLADVLGINTFASVIGARTKTTDELLADIHEVVEDSLDIAAAALATQNLTPDVPEREERYEVRRLVPNGMRRGSMHYILEETATSYEGATSVKERYAKIIPEAILAVVRVEVTTQVDVYPGGHPPRL